MKSSHRPASPRSRFDPAAWLGRALLVAASFCLALGLARSAAAQTSAADPPGRVARLSEIAGPTWLFHPDNGDWVQAERNLPLTTGDRLATDAGARAELQIGSTTLQLDAGSELEVVALDDTHIALQLHAGALAARIRNAAEAGQVDVLTDDGRFLVLRAGSYRFDRGTRSSFASVDSGEVRYEFQTSALNVGAGQRGEFWVDAAGAAQYALLSPVADAFTAWSADRDRAFDRSTAARYASPEMTGVEELDRYGTWEQTPDYGAVWYPTAVAADWAPYSTGRWTWVRPWGWTWVDAAPWGFAPFHYGRWVNVRNRWCWTPGVRQPRPVWAPALVGWVGGGAPGNGQRGGGPAVGWFPLAPREVYLPSYASTPRYVLDINRTHVRNPSLITAAINDPRSARDFENRRFPHAVTVVPATTMTERRPFGPADSRFRDTPWARDFAQRGGPAVVLTAPPVAAPTMPSRGDDRRPSRPPPGFAERDGRGGRDLADERGRGARPGLPAPVGTAGDPRLPRGDRDGLPDRSAQTPVGRPGFAAQPGTVAPPTSITPQSREPIAPQPREPMVTQPGLSPPPGANRGNAPGLPSPEFSNRGPQTNPPGYRPPANAGAQTTPQTQPQMPPPRPLSPNDADISPRMRTQPVRRGEDRRIGGEAGLPPGGRPDTAPANRPENVPAPRPQFAPPQAPQAAPVRPVEAPRAPERVSPVQPVAPTQPAAPRPEPQSPRLAPPRPPEAQRPAPAESPRVGGPDRRGDPNVSR